MRNIRTPKGLNRIQKRKKTRESRKGLSLLMASLLTLATLGVAFVQGAASAPEASAADRPSAGYTVVNSASFYEGINSAQFGQMSSNMVIRATVTCPSGATSISARVVKIAQPYGRHEVASDWVRLPCNTTSSRSLWGLTRDGVRYLQIFAGSVRGRYTVSTVTVRFI